MYVLFGNTQYSAFNGLSDLVTSGKIEDMSLGNHKSEFY
jgi:hypothetical protein